MLGTGIISDPYLVSTADDLNNVRNNLSAYYKQTADIDLSSYTNWVPIGTYSVPFTGMYDGDNFNILGLTINEPTMSDVGLFGTVKNENNDFCLKNINIVNCNILALDYIGALSGDLIGNMYNCHSSGSITDASATSSGCNGGLIGYISNNVPLRILKCSSSCNITIQSTGGDSFGGLFGQVGNDQGGWIYLCHATGNLIGNIDNTLTIGGLIGKVFGGQFISKYVNIENCYATGNITGYGTLGGLIGDVNYSNVSKCYAIGSITAPQNPVHVGALFGVSAAQIAVTSCFYNNETYTLLTNEDTEHGFPEGSIFSTSTIQMKTQSTFINWDFIINWAIDSNSTINNGYPYIKENIFAGGSGTEADPYLVANANQLHCVRNNLMAYFKQIADIDLHEYSNWESIGKYKNEFKGVYDGQDFSIKNLTISADVSNIGLFGVTLFNLDRDNTAELKNINLINVNIATTNTAVGALVGNSMGCAFTNCHSSGVVQGTSEVGGLIGNFFQYYDEIARYAIKQCSSSCTVIGTGIEIPDSAGGLIGYCSADLVENCYATGNVSGGSRVGGFSGFLGNDGTSVDVIVRNCYSAGNITKTLINDKIGGFTGETEGKIQLINCYSSGSITGYNESDTVYGGFIGIATGTGTVITDCYYDATVSGCSDTIKGTPKTTAEMKTQSTYVSWDFITPIWFLDSNGLFNNGYPLLSEMSILIYTPEQLNNIRNYLNKNYIQMADIDLSSYTNWVPIGDNIVSDNPFIGSYNGNNFKISNITSDHLLADDYNIGLFGLATAESEISPIIFKNINIVNANIKGGTNVGALVGSTDAQIDNCHSSGTVISIDGICGGLIGRLTLPRYNGDFASFDNFVINCSSSCNVSSLDTINNDNSDISTGGLIGTSTCPKISNCYATGNVSGSNEIGGLIGHVYDDINYTRIWNGISKCYATGNVSGNYDGSDYIGGLIGELYPQKGEWSLSNCYSIGDVSSTYTNCYIGGLLGEVAKISVINCYSSGNVSALDSGGGIAGSVSGGAILNNCYYDSNKATTNYSEVGISKTTAEMKIQSTYVNWDFINIWDIDSQVNNGYPYFGINTNGSEEPEEPEEPTNPTKRKRRLVIFI